MSILKRLIADMEKEHGAPAEEIEKDPAKYNYHSAITDAAAARGAILIINGRNDDNSPVSVIDLYVSRLRAAGKSVETYLPDNGPHGFYFGRPELPETAEATRRAVAFFKQQFAAVEPARPGPKASGTSAASTPGFLLPKVWVDPDHTAPAGTAYKTFHSATIDADASYLIYVPPDYDSSGGTRYPVLYELHATGNTPRGGAAIVAGIDAAIRAGKVAPMIIVMPNGLRGETMYCDSKDGRYPVESVIIKDLIPHIDATYRTIADRSGRGLDGFSMGGYGAAHLGFKYPEIFGVISIQAPPLLGPDLKAPLPMHAWARLYPAAFGSDPSYYTANDPFALLVKNADQLRDRTVIRLVTHVEPEDWLAPRCEQLHQVLVRQRIAHEFDYLSNVKSHNRGQVTETLGDASWSFYGTGFARLKAQSETHR